MKRKQFGLILASGALAGVMIGVGGTVFLASADKTVGAVLFSVGLLTICNYGLRLFTGAIGYLLTDSGTPWGPRLLTAGGVWLGNLAGTGLVGWLVWLFRPELAQKSLAMAQAKLALDPIAAFVLAVFCGMLMYLAVDIYRNQTGAYRLAGIMVAVPVFILAGFEHSIADMFYLAAGFGFALSSTPALFLLLVVTFGNSVGAVLMTLPKRIQQAEKN